MKTPSDNLFQLIHSLDMNEKRYLSMFTGHLHGQSGSKQYMDLIRVLERQEVFDEAQAKKKTGISDAAYFKRLKHYAYEHTLRSLENYHANTTPEALILRKFMQAELLLRKKQFASLRRCIDQAYRLCLEHDKLLFLPACLDWKLRTGLAEPRLKQTGNVAATELRERLEHLSIWLQLRRINVLSWKLITRETAPTKKELVQVRSWIRETLRLIPEGALDFTLAREYGQTLSTCYRLLGEWENSLKYRVMLVRKIESEPHKMKLRCFEYLSAVNNVFIAYKNLGKKGLDKFIDKATAFYSRMPSRLLTLRINDAYVNLINNHVALLLDEKQTDTAYEKARALLKIAEKNAFRFSNNLVPILYSNLSIAALYRGELREARRFHAKLEGSYRHQHAEVMLLGLIIYFEAGDTDLLHYRLRSFNKLLRKSKEAWPLARTIGNALSSYLGEAAGKAQKREAFRQLQDELRQTGMFTNEGADFGSFDYGLWIAAGVNGKSLREEMTDRSDRKRNF